MEDLLMTTKFAAITALSLLLALGMLISTEK